jgi:hypothetical protein
MMKQKKKFLLASLETLSSTMVQDRIVMQVLLPGDKHLLQELEIGD